MPKINVYVDQALYRKIRRYKVPISATAQSAFVRKVAAREREANARRAAIRAEREQQSNRAA